MEAAEARGYAQEDFGHANLGDARRNTRVVAIGAAGYRRPGGRVLQVCRTSAERQGAYDFLRNPSCSPKAVTDALGVGTAKRCAEHPFVFVSVDGSSLSLTDAKGAKEFGNIGSTAQGGRGLKMITGFALEPNGTPIGVLDQQWWSRRSAKKRHDHRRRSVAQKETKHWLECADECKRRLRQQAPDTRICFLFDRESDRRHTLESLRDSGEMYIVRSAFDRRLHGEDTCYLLKTLRKVAPTHGYVLDVPGGPKRTARQAHMLVRTTRVTLRLRDPWTKKAEPFEVTVVEAREEGTVPPSQKPIEWRLLTNLAVETAADADYVVASYALRWSIESFHRTWKTGACNVEDSQLREVDHVVKWATIMAAVAARIERLKVLSRNEPKLPADRELSKYEIAALITLKREHKKRTETIPDAVPTLAQAVYWIAELGGYTGKSSGGPPGSITIQRGFDYIAPAAALLEALEKQGKLR